MGPESTLSQSTLLLRDAVGHTALNPERSGGGEVGAQVQREREEEKRAEQTGPGIVRLQSSKGSQNTGEQDCPRQGEKQMALKVEVSLLSRGFPRTLGSQCHWLRQQDY